MVTHVSKNVGNIAARMFYRNCVFSHSYSSGGVTLTGNKKRGFNWYCLSHYLRVQSGRAASPAIWSTGNKSSEVQEIHHYHVIHFGIVFVLFLAFHHLHFLFLKAQTRKHSWQKNYPCYFYFCPLPFPCLYLWRMNDARNGVKQLLCSSS